MPGVTYAAIRGDSVVLTGGKGYADRTAKRPLTPSIRFMIASISKTIAATALMQLYEKDLVALDGDISDYLPFTVRNPHYPDVPITVEMLLTHTSSISDEGIDALSMLIFGYVDYWRNLMSFQKKYLVKGGVFYTEKNFSEHKPGTNCEYSNVGATLIACLVEYISNTDYNTYCIENIFSPLGMTRTTWFFEDTPEDEMAVYYTDNYDLSSSDQYVTTPLWAECHLITTIEDLSRFLIAYMAGGTFDNCTLLDSATIDLMLTSYCIKSTGEQQGLIFHSRKIGTRTLWGHGGDMAGMTTDMYFDKSDSTGFIIFTNRMEARSDVMAEALLEYAHNSGK